MTIDNVCYVCGADGLCINGLCPDCTMEEFRNPGVAFAATFGTISEDAIARYNLRHGEPLPFEEGAASESVDLYLICQILEIDIRDVLPTSAEVKLP